MGTLFLSDLQFSDHPWKINCLHKENQQFLKVPNKDILSPTPANMRYMYEGGGFTIFRSPLRNEDFTPGKWTIPKSSHTSIFCHPPLLFLGTCMREDESEMWISHWNIRKPESQSLALHHTIGPHTCPCIHSINSSLLSTELYSTLILIFIAHWLLGKSYTPPIFIWWSCNTMPVFTCF